MTRTREGPKTQNGIRAVMAIIAATGIPTMMATEVRSAAFIRVPILRVPLTMTATASTPMTP